MASLVETIVVEPCAGTAGALARHAVLVNPDGTAFRGDAPGAATASSPGLVKQAAPVADAASDADAAALAATVNGLLASLRAAGVIGA